MSTYCVPQSIQQHIAVQPRLSKTSLFPLANSLKTSLILPFSQGRRWVPLSEILRLEGVGNYTNVYFMDGSQLLVALSLKVFIDRVPAGSLIRAHRKHLLNTQYIDAVSAAQSLVILTNGERLPLARRRMAGFRKEWRGL